MIFVVFLTEMEIHSTSRSSCRIFPRTRRFLGHLGRLWRPDAREARQGDRVRSDAVVGSHEPLFLDVGCPKKKGNQLSLSPRTFITF
jgi:hypothetical protein